MGRDQAAGTAGRPMLCPHKWEPLEPIHANRGETFTSAPPWGRFACLFTYVCIKWVLTQFHFRHFGSYHLPLSPHTFCFLFRMGGRCGGPCPTLESHRASVALPGDGRPRFFLRVNLLLTSLPHAGLWLNWREGAQSPWGLIILDEFFRSPSGEQSRPAPPRPGTVSGRAANGVLSGCRLQVWGPSLVGCFC